MKIIGRGEERKFIVEVDKDEFAKLLGEDSEFSYFYQKDHPREFQIGKTYPVSKIFEKARKVLAYYKEFATLFKEFGEKAEFMKKLLSKDFDEKEESNG